MCQPQLSASLSLCCCAPPPTFRPADETPENRKLAKELVARWARPILAPRRSTDALDEQARTTHPSAPVWCTASIIIFPCLCPQEAERILQARQAKQQQQRARQRTSAVDADEEEPGVRPLRPGDPGFRWHAAIPQAASLDYVRRPQAQFSMPERKAGAKGGEKEHRLTKKLAAISKAAKASGRAAQVSVEGALTGVGHAAAGGGGGARYVQALAAIHRLACSRARAGRNVTIQH